MKELSLQVEGGETSICRTLKRLQLHHFEPETKRQTMELHHASSTKKKKFKTASSARNVIAIEFFDSEGLLLLDIMPHGTTINSDWVSFDQIGKSKMVLLLHINARARQSQNHRQHKKLGWATLKHPPYSPALALCDYNLFGKMMKRASKIKTPSWTLLNSGADALIQSSIVQVYRSLFQSGVRQLKGTEIMEKSYILFKDQHTVKIAKFWNKN